MSVQKLFTSRANSTNGNTYIGERGHMFYNADSGAGSAHSDAVILNYAIIRVGG